MSNTFSHRVREWERECLRYNDIDITGNSLDNINIALITVHIPCCIILYPIKIYRMYTDIHFASVATSYSIDYDFSSRAIPCNTVEAFDEFQMNATTNLQYSRLVNNLEGFIYPSIVRMCLCSVAMLWNIQASFKLKVTDARWGKNVPCIFNRASISILLENANNVRAIHKNMNETAITNESLVERVFSSFLDVIIEPHFFSLGIFKIS